MDDTEDLNRALTRMTLAIETIADAIATHADVLRRQTMHPAIKTIAASRNPAGSAAKLSRHQSRYRRSARYPAPSRNRGIRQKR